jgi:predicted aldo/keto reductase-like oxidoreductase
MLASSFDCTVAQLAIGNYEYFLQMSYIISSLLAWCLKNESVHCILLGASSAEQLYENINSLSVNTIEF